MVKTKNKLKIKSLKKAKKQQPKEEQSNSKKDNLKFDRVLNVSEIAETRAIQKVLDNLFALQRPKSNITSMLNNIGNLFEKSADELEELLAGFTAWRNYLGEQSIIADSILTVAKSQTVYFYSRGVDRSSGSINEKKQKAYSGHDYISAKATEDEAESIFNAINMKFENCERAYALVSRILTKRFNIKEY